MSSTERWQLGSFDSIRERHVEHMPIKSYDVCTHLVGQVRSTVFAPRVRGGFPVAGQPRFRGAL